jgi:hypothetical protein
LVVVGWIFCQPVAQLKVPFSTVRQTDPPLAPSQAILKARS